MTEFQKFATIAAALVLALVLVGAWLLLAWWAGRYISRETKAPKLAPPLRSYPAAACLHQWRSIAPPYGRQCRLCGVMEFREDPSGNIPDGFREYFDYIKERDNARFRDEAEEIARQYNEGKNNVRQAMDRTTDERGTLPDHSTPGHDHDND